MVLITNHELSITKTYITFYNLKKETKLPYVHKKLWSRQKLRVSLNHRKFIHQIIYFIMLKKISNLGKSLNKTEQKKISGGKPPKGGCPKGGYSWNPHKRCCWSYTYNCCAGSPECPPPY